MPKSCALSTVLGDLLEQGAGLVDLRFGAIDQCISRPSSGVATADAGKLIEKSQCLANGCGHAQRLDRRAGHCRSGARKTGETEERNGGGQLCACVHGRGISPVLPVIYDMPTEYELLARSESPADRCCLWRAQAATYWSPRLRREVFLNAVAHSLIAGVFVKGVRRCKSASARLVTDQATFAWLADVWIDPAHRGLRLSKQMVKLLLDDPRLQTLRRCCLATRDAHGLYTKLGFAPVKEGRWMEKVAPDEVWQEPLAEELAAINIYIFSDRLLGSAAAVTAMARGASVKTTCAQPRASIYERSALSGRS